MPSYIEPSAGFIDRLNPSKNKIDNDAILLAIYVEALYTSIDYECGINAVVQCIRNHNLPNNKINFVKDAIEIVLLNNIFQFDGQLYLTIMRTALSTPMAQ
ncbi:hypothetical protein GJ496_009964 [Pomphorhynchus laevis]|nr:hypothetical protein GJ496_009964 [Pomphorhynchus laevis]